MAREFVFVLVLFFLSSEGPVFASSHGALEKLIEWHGSGGSLSQEEFISLGKGVQSGQAVTTNGDLLAGKNGSCVSTSALCVKTIVSFCMCITVQSMILISRVTELHAVHDIILDNS